MTKLVYTPVLRSRQQENIVLKTFDFGKSIYPIVEIIKEFDRKRKDNKQRDFGSIYTSIIEDINAEKVFIDIPLYLNERRSMKTEVLLFSRQVISNIDERLNYMLTLAPVANKIIPVISSYNYRNGSTDSIEYQVEVLRPKFSSICYRILYSNFENDWKEVIKSATEEDYIILDIDTLSPYPTPALRSIIDTWKDFDLCTKVIIRSAINNDIQNVSLNHGDVIFEADNGLIEQYNITFKADAFGDYAGVKKDDLTSGGTISPGFIFYDALNNQYIGFKGNIKDLAEFENTIVPAVINSETVENMLRSGYDYLVNENIGWNMLNRINNREESGKSQAKFKRIAIEHYLHCMKTKIEEDLI